MTRQASHFPVLTTPPHQGAFSMTVQQRNNVNIHSDGPVTMLFAHGFGCDQALWRFVAPSFADDHFVVTFDYLGALAVSVAFPLLLVPQLGLIRTGLLFGLMNAYVGVLSLVPLPPLDGGRLLFGLAPRTSGWQKAEYHLVEQNIGLVAVLVLLLLPLGGPQALLPVVLDRVVSPLVRLATGG